MTSQPSQSVPLWHFSQPLWEVLRYHRSHSATCSQTFGIQGAPARRYHIEARPNGNKKKGLGIDARRVNVGLSRRSSSQLDVWKFPWRCFISHPKGFLKEDQGRSFLDERRNVFKETSARPAASYSGSGTTENVVLTSVGTLNEVHTEICSPVQSGDAVGASGWENNRWEGLCVFSRVLELLFKAPSEWEISMFLFLFRPTGWRKQHCPDRRFTDHIAAMPRGFRFNHLEASFPLNLWLTFSR